MIRSWKAIPLHGVSWWAAVTVSSIAFAATMSLSTRLWLNIALVLTLTWPFLIKPSTRNTFMSAFLAVAAGPLLIFLWYREFEPLLMFLIVYHGFLAWLSIVIGRFVQIKFPRHWFLGFLAGPLIFILYVTREIVIEGMMSLYLSIGLLLPLITFFFASLPLGVKLLNRFLRFLEVNP